MQLLADFVSKVTFLQPLTLKISIFCNLMIVSQIYTSDQSFKTSWKTARIYILHCWILKGSKQSFEMQHGEKGVRQKKCKQLIANNN